MGLIRRPQRARHPEYPKRAPAMLTLRDEMNRLFDDFFYGFENKPFPDIRREPGEEFVPTVDISETDGEIRVAAELPGLTEDDVDVEVEDDRVTISGEKKVEEEERETDRYWSESAYGRFIRQIPLPEAIEPDGAQATLRQGRLLVKLPKRDGERSRRRTVEISPG